MTIQEAFKAWWNNQPHALPWEQDENDAFRAFEAGWTACGNGNAGVAQLAEQAVCSGQVAGSTPATSSTVTSVDVCGDAVTAEDIYRAYPRKVGKQAAIKAIEKAIKACRGMCITTESLNVIRGYFQPGAIINSSKYVWAKTMAYASAVAQWPEADKQFIPHPATWFNRGSYDDDPKEWARGTAATTSQFRTHH